MKDFAVTLNHSLGSLRESYSKVFSAKNKKRAASLAIAEFKAIQPFSIKGEVIEVESVIETDPFAGLGDFEISEEVAEEFVQCELNAMSCIALWLTELLGMWA